MDQPSTIFLLTEIASTRGFVIACVLLGAYLTAARGVRIAGIFLITTVGLMVSTTVLKEWFQTPRPLNGLVAVSGYAFPSGHASGSMYLGLILGYFYKNLSPWIKTSLFVFMFSLVLMIGFSRIWYDVHTPLQVVAGYALGIMWAITCMQLIKRSR